MRSAMERQDITFRKCVPPKKRLAMALWKLATGSEYRTVGHLFGVSITTVCGCVQEFAAAAEMLLVPEPICFPDQEKFAEIAAYTERRWGIPQCIDAIDGSHIPIIAPQEYHCDYFNRKAGTPSSFKVLLMERDCSGTCLQEWLAARMMLVF